MRREWAIADPQAFEEEMTSLSPGDEAKLVALMEIYAASGIRPEPPVYVEDYGAGLLCLRHTSGAYKGRCLFFTVMSLSDYQLCVVLKVYRKQSQKADPKAIEQARNRMENLKTQ